MHRRNDRKSRAHRGHQRYRSENLTHPGRDRKYDRSEILSRALTPHESGHEISDMLSEKKQDNSVRRESRHSGEATREIGEQWVHQPTFQRKKNIPQEKV